MRKSSMIALVCVLVGVVSVCAQETTVMPTSTGPRILEKVGSTRDELPAYRYPKFIEFQRGNSPRCEAYLQEQYRDDPATDGNPGIADTGMSLAPLYVGSTFGSRRGVPDAYRGTFEPVNELVDVPVVIEPEYRSTAKLLITWTLRVEAQSPGAYQVRDTLCRGWSGVSRQEFPSGVIASRLKVDGAGHHLVSPEVTMTLPHGGVSQRRDQRPRPIPVDPTNTGSFLVTPADFGGAFPETLNLTLEWKNDSSMELTTPGSMRSLIVVVVPLEKVE